MNKKNDSINGLGVIVIMLAGGLVGFLAAVNVCVWQIQPRGIIYSQAPEKRTTAPLRVPESYKQPCLHVCKPHPFQPVLSTKLLQGGY